MKKIPQSIPVGMFVVYLNRLSTATLRVNISSRHFPAEDQDRYYALGFSHVRGCRHVNGWCIWKRRCVVAVQGASSSQTSTTSWSPSVFSSLVKGLDQHPPHYELKEASILFSSHKARSDHIYSKQIWQPLILSSYTHSSKSPPVSHTTQGCKIKSLHNQESCTQKHSTDSSAMSTRSTQCCPWTFPSALQGSSVTISDAPSSHRGWQ